MFLLIICFTNVIECAIILTTHASIYLWSKIKLLDNVKIHNANLYVLFRGFKYFNFIILSYCTTLSVVGKFILAIKERIRKYKVD